ncbi:alpha/beta-hydrolase [Daedaleopsis nitida]|nr:alpha/beta-hydrolase [Daedaleopsis nitida]
MGKLTSIAPVFLPLVLSLFEPSAHAAAVTNANSGDTTQAIQWGSCDSFGIPNSTLTCGFFDIPLDYHDPSAGKGRIAVVKANATGTRQGTFFYNPGGPGGSGLSEGLADVATTNFILNLTGGNYDIVSWDPRGVGAYSIPGEVYCFDSVDEYNSFFNGTIEATGIEMYGKFTDPADIRNLFAQADTLQKKYTEVGKRCVEHSQGKYLKYMGTAATARDLLALAEALDGAGKPVNFYGASYGTMLGAWFVNMFPDRVGKFILDGVVDVVSFGTEDLAIWFSTWLIDTDRVYEGFITGCALAGPEHCAIAAQGQTPAELHAGLQALLRAADDKAHQDPTFLNQTSGVLRDDLFVVMYGPSVWSSITNEFLPGIINSITGKEAERGGVNTTLAKRVDEAIRSVRKRAESDTRAYSTSAIFCADGKDSFGALNMTDIFEHVIDAVRDITHMFGALWPFHTYYCDYWPARSVERYTGPFNKTLANPIIVIGNTYDPVTPFKNAKRLAELLGDSAGLVRLNGFGHSIQAAPSACIIDVVNAYVINGTVPSGEDTVCEVDESFEMWPGVNTKTILDHMSKDGLQY